jgi:hypothetical protein
MGTLGEEKSASLMDVVQGDVLLKLLASKDELPLLSEDELVVVLLRDDGVVWIWKTSSLGWKFGRKSRKWLRSLRSDELMNHYHFDLRLWVNRLSDLLHNG